MQIIILVRGGRGRKGHKIRLRFAADPPSVETLGPGSFWSYVLRAASNGEVISRLSRKGMPC